MNTLVLATMLVAAVCLLPGQTMAASVVDTRAAAAIGDPDLFCLNGAPNQNGTQGDCVFWVCGEPYPCVCWQTGFIPVTSPCSIVPYSAAPPSPATAPVTPSASLVAGDGDLFCLYARADQGGTQQSCAVRICDPGSPCVCFDTTEMVPCLAGGHDAMTGDSPVSGAAEVEGASELLCVHHHDPDGNQGACWITVCAPLGPCSCIMGDQTPYSICIRAQGAS